MFQTPQRMVLPIRKKYIVLTFAFRIKDFIIFAASEKDSTQKNTTVGDLQTPGIEDLAQCIETLIFVENHIILKQSCIKNWISQLI